jgi:hypothetical protein
MVSISACGTPVQGTGSLDGSASATPVEHHALANAADTALAQTILLGASGLPSGWTLVGRRDYTVADLSASPCLANFPGYVAGAVASYSYHLDPKTNYEQGHLAVEVRITDGVADAQQQLNLLNSAAATTASAKACWLDGYRTNLARAVGVENVLAGGLILAGKPRVSSLPGWTLSASVPYRFGNANKIEYLDDIRIQKGRIVVRLLFKTCCQPFPYASQEAPAVEAVAKRIASASTS